MPRSAGSFPVETIEVTGEELLKKLAVAHEIVVVYKEVPTATLISPPLSPNDVVVSNNSVTCAQNGILLTGLSGRTIQNVSVTGNGRPPDSARTSFPPPGNRYSGLFSGTGRNYLPRSPSRFKLRQGQERLSNGKEPPGNSEAFLFRKCSVRARHEPGRGGNGCARTHWGAMHGVTFLKSLTLLARD